MKKVLIIFGNMSFEEEPHRATIHTVTSTAIVDYDTAGQCAEKGLETADSYFIPSQYSGQIVWAENNTY